MKMHSIVLREECNSHWHTSCCQKSMVVTILYNLSSLFYANLPVKFTKTELN